MHVVALAHMVPDPVDSAITHLNKSIKGLEALTEESPRKDIQAVETHVKNGLDRVQQALKEHQDLRGAWHSPDMNIETEFKNLTNQLYAIQGRLTKLSDSKKQKRKKK